MHLNKVTLIGRVGARGPQLTYAEQAIPTCRFTREVDEPGKSGQCFTTWLPVEIVSKFAESAAEPLEPGDEVMIDVRLKYSTTVDSKRNEKTNKLMVTSWMVTPAVQRWTQPMRYRRTEAPRDRDYDRE